MKQAKRFLIFAEDQGVFIADSTTGLSNRQSDRPAAARSGTGTWRRDWVYSPHL
jgi:hypothetical protein